MRPGHSLLLLMKLVVLSGCAAVPASRMVDGGVLTPQGRPLHAQGCAPPQASGALTGASPQEVASHTALRGPVQALVGAGDSAVLRDHTSCGHGCSASSSQDEGHIAEACRAVAAALAQGDRSALAQKRDALHRLICKRWQFLAAHPDDGALGKTWCRQCACQHRSRVLFALCQVMRRLSQVEECGITPCCVQASATAAGATP